MWSRSSAAVVRLPSSTTATKGRVTATVNGKRIADTREALTLKEAAYPPVQYIPRKDVEMLGSLAKAAGIEPE